MPAATASSFVQCVEREQRMFVGAEATRFVVLRKQVLVHHKRRVKTMVLRFSVKTQNLRERATLCSSLKTSRALHEQRVFHIIPCTKTCLASRPVRAQMPELECTDAVCFARGRCMNDAALCPTNPFSAHGLPSVLRVVFARAQRFLAPTSCFVYARFVHKQPAFGAQTARLFCARLVHKRRGFVMLC